MQFTYFLSRLPGNICQSLIIALLTTMLGGCQSSGYLWQAIKGQWQLLSGRQPIDQLVNNEQTPAELKEKLSYVIEIREFAEERLKLPVDNAYSEYVDLQRPFVVWNLFVAPELEMKPESWCYPVAGCVSYQGYFHQEDAEAARQNWERENYDTYVGGVSAYSTLGWFDDPVLNTFINYDRISLAALLFHELAHRRLYIKNDTTFNESWATAVEQEAILLFTGQSPFLDEHPNDSLVSVGVTRSTTHLREEIQRYQQRFKERQRFVDMVQQTVSKLKSLYAEDQTEQHKRRKKEEILEELRQQYQQAVSAGSISNAYSNWITSPLNNAKLMTIVSYHQWVPGLRYKLRTLQNDFQAFYEWSEQLETLEKPERRRLLEQLNALATRNIAGAENLE